VSGLGEPGSGAGGAGVEDGGGEDASPWVTVSGVGGGLVVICGGRAGRRRPADSAEGWLVWTRWEVCVEVGGEFLAIALAISARRLCDRWECGACGSVGGWCAGGGELES